MGLIKRKTEEKVFKERRKNKRDFESLIKGLSDPDPMVRRWNARDLAGFPEAVPALLEQLRKEKERSVKEVIITSLLRIASDEAIKGLVECLRSDDAYLRNAAIEALKHFPHKVSPLMERLLKDPDPDIRIFAINIMESLKDERIEEWLIEIIKNDPDVNVCGTALDLLCEIGTEKSASAIRELRKRMDNPYIRFTSEIALKRIEGDYV